MGKMGALFDIFVCFDFFHAFLFKCFFLCLCVCCDNAACTLRQSGHSGLFGKSVEIAEKGGKRKVKVGGEVEKGLWGSRMKWPLALVNPTKCCSLSFLDFQWYPLFSIILLNSIHANNVKVTVFHKS
jgi:hypothetical protein